MRIVLSSTFALLVGMGAAFAFPTAEVPTSEAAYVAKLKTAAPEEIVARSTILMTQDGKERSVQTGTNGFTCFIAGDGTPLCGDEAGIAWFKAIGAKSDPPSKIGFIYMLAGDTGTTKELMRNNRVRAVLVVLERWCSSSRLGRHCAEC